MKKIWIVKAGNTFSDTARKYGDFEDWTRTGLELKPQDADVLDPGKTDTLPGAETCAGVIITGSHAMVTNRPDWSERVAAWIPGLMEDGIPVLGICYGHQLLAYAMGGRVGFHQGGQEIGTVEIDVMKAGSEDLLFRGLPSPFPVHVTHSQTVLTLPPGAVRLAANAFEPNHAFRIGACGWGVQFHPEYSTGIMASYIEQQSDALRSAGRNPEAILSRVRETPEAAEVLKRFGRFIRNLRP